MHYRQRSHPNHGHYPQHSERGNQQEQLRDRLVGGGGSDADRQGGEAERNTSADQEVKNCKQKELVASPSSQGGEPGEKQQERVRRR